MSESQATAPVSYRPIPEFPGYRVGDDGSVWSSWICGNRARITTSWRETKQRTKNNGYRVVSLRDADRRKRLMHVHSLVLTAFIGPRQPGMVSCHQNGKRDDNRLDNLRWDTAKNNEADKITHGTDNRFRKVSDEQAQRIKRECVKRGDRARLARELGVSGATITRVCRNVVHYAR